MSEKIVLIDGHSILNRAFYGIPLLTNGEGLRTNAVYGFLNILFKVLEEEQASYLAVAFDLHAPTFRHKMYEPYKGTRSAMPDDLRMQVPLIKEMLTDMGVPLMMLEGYEADDLLGTVSRQMEEKGLIVRIISGDRDLLQLASEKTMIRIPKTKMSGTEVEDYLAADVLEKYEVTPKEFIDLKALMGDASDNIPGLPGVGPKTATKIIVSYHSIENAHEHVDEITPKKAQNAMREHWDLAVLSKTLATIDRYAKTEDGKEFGISLDEARLKDGVRSLYTAKALEMAKRLELRTIVERFISGMDGAALQDTAGEKKDDFRFVILKDGAMDEAAGAGAGGNESGDSSAAENDGAGSIKAGSGSSGSKAAESESSGSSAAENDAENSVKTDFMHAQDLLEMISGKEIGLQVLAEDGLLYGAAVSDGSRTVFVQNIRSDLLREICRKAKMVDAIHLKEQLFWLDDGSDFTAEEQEKFFDGAIGAYLLNPLAGEYSYDNISKDHSGRLLPSRSELLGKKSLKKAAQDAGLSEETGVPMDDGSGRSTFLDYACFQAMTALSCRESMLRKLEEEQMKDLFFSVEMPVAFVLYHMEKEGVLVRGDELREYGEKLSGRIDELEKEIWELAGRSFNINSPKQLGVILFEEMKLPGGKKTKTGYSTAADVLEKLAESTPMVAKILEYRQLTKLRSTYAEGLSAFISPDGRIHGKFHQTVTATGRLSSADPNLQNIPVRTELGRELRKIFVAKEGSTFIDADYSQIELRVLAHVSGDEKLIEAYNSAEDIHAVTASQVFHVPLSEVTPQLRRNAKAVNFGIVYGISSFGLSQGLSITRQEAQDYIAQYFHTYPGIKSYLDGCVESAKALGYSVTMFGRRRPIPELKESNFMRRSFGERVAMNAPIQGTAADIIKIAMIGVDRTLRAEGLRSRLVLQIHDELLIETAAGEEERVRKILEEKMMGAADMRVRLEIDMHSGANWYEAH